MMCSKVIPWSGSRGWRGGLGISVFKVVAWPGAFQSVYHSTRSAARSCAYPLRSRLRRALRPDETQVRGKRFFAIIHLLSIDNIDNMSILRVKLVHVSSLLDSLTSDGHGSNSLYDC
jgi:hypothetical protein